MMSSLEIAEALAAPFGAGDVKFKPGVVTGARALALPYLDARAVQQRLDDVCGIENWRAEYQFLPAGCVLCTLFLRLGGEWVGKSDVGSPSEQPDAGDRAKSAVSDSLKRAAVAWGVGRYLYRQAPLWVDWNAQAKRFDKAPQLPRAAAATRPLTPAVAEAARRGLAGSAA